ITAFLVAPLADRWIIPYAASASGRESLEPLLGVGTPVSRGIALVFLAAGLIMVAAALLALRSPAFRVLSRTYAVAAPGDLRTDARPGEIVTTASGAAAAVQTDRVIRTDIEEDG